MVLFAHFYFSGAFHCGCHSHNRLVFSVGECLNLIFLGFVVPLLFLLTRTLLIEKPHLYLFDSGSSSAADLVQTHNSLASTS